MKCPKCRAINRDTAKFCAKCAAPLSESEPAPSAATRPTAPMSGTPPRGSDVARQPTKPLPGAVEATDAKSTTRPLPVHQALSSPRQPQSSAADDPTAPLPNLPRGFAPLPPGALLNDDRYEILDIQEPGQQINIYQVRDSHPVRRCPNPDCGALDDAAQETHCPSCGADLSAVRPVHLTFTLREAANPTQFDAERQLVERDLSHAGLLLPKAHFQETPYADSRRAYQILAYVPLLAASLPAPPDLPRVLQWGVQLAQAMAFLHDQHVCLRQVDAGRIAIEQDGRAARWTNLTGVEMAPDAPLFAQDVRLLAQTLFYLATGASSYAPTVEMPDPAKSLFARALISQQQPFASAREFAQALEELLGQVLRPSALLMSVGYRSDVGRQRQLNEDGLLTLALDQAVESTGQPLGLFVVADGMGGHSAGEVATRLALAAVRQKAVTELISTTAAPASADQWLADANSAANTAVYEHRRQAGTDMGNTMIMALLVGDTATLSNVGDSRAYLVNEREIRQLTTDHSLVERLVATGKITPEEARTHPQRNVIYRTIGDKARVEADLYHQRLNIGDYLLLCSDGLTGMVTDKDIHYIIRSSMSPQEACDRLVRAANDAGGIDNITVILIQINA